MLFGAVTEDTWRSCGFNYRRTPCPPLFGRSPRGADDLDAEDEIATIAERADADIAAGRYVTVITQEDSNALHDGASKPPPVTTR